MNNNEINRLNFEDILWGIFIILSVMNIISNSDQKKYVITGDNRFEDSANDRTVLVLSILFMIYLYFFLRNANMYINKLDRTNIDFIKVFGSFLFVVSTFCLLYFQIRSKDNFID